jgi:hypothetical protein
MSRLADHDYAHAMAEAMRITPECLVDTTKREPDLIQIRIDLHRRNFAVLVEGKTTFVTYPS